MPIHTDQNNTQGLSTVTGVILAGGQQRRFPGPPKALRKVGKTTILDHLLATLKPIFSQVLLVTNEPQTFLPWDLTIVPDVIDQRCSLTGIHSGLFHVTTNYCFVCGCDMPFLNPDLVHHICAGCDGSVDVVIPQTQYGFEPMCAAYAQRCLEPIERNLSRNRLQIVETIKKLKVRTISEKQVLRIDPHLTSFINVNAAQDLDRANRIFEERKETDGFHPS